MDLCNESCSSVQPADWMAGQLGSQPLSVCLSVLRDKNFNVGHYVWTFHPSSLIPAMLVDTIDFYPLIPLSVTLSLAGGHKVIIVITIMIVTLKGPIQDFLPISLLRHKLSLTHGQGVVVCRSLSIHDVPCCMRGRPSCQVWQSLNCIYFSFMLLVEIINQWRRGGNQSTQRKPLMTSLRKCHILKLKNSSPNQDLNRHSSIGGRLGKQTC